MGQCSTLPAENQVAPNSYVGARYHNVQKQQTDNAVHSGQNYSSPSPSRRGNHQMQFDNSATPVRKKAMGMDPNRTDGRTYSSLEQRSYRAPGASSPMMNNTAPRPETRSKSMISHQRGCEPSGSVPQQQKPESMQIEAPQQPLSQPPDAAIRARCYRLNLDSPIPSPLTDAARSVPRTNLGPLSYEEDQGLVICKSEDSVKKSSTGIAIETAKIFRGITVSSDGTITGQNARASRASKGKPKAGEKSRQAAKIDKANDLVEEVAAGAGGEGEEKVKMVSLVIMGEYDDMKHLVRDGSKKLRDADGLPDDSLLSMNQPRHDTGVRTLGGSPLGNPGPQLPMSPTNRKRMSPHVSATTPVNGAFPRSKLSVIHSAPPKLKEHPRDRPRRLDGDGRQQSFTGRFQPVRDPCHSIPMFDGESDWSSSLRGLNSIWNCGAGVNTTRTRSPENGEMGMPVTYEGRNESNNNFRAADHPMTQMVSERVAAPDYMTERKNGIAT